jgi:hypothetical protein
MRIKQGLEMGAFASAHKTTTKYRPQKHGVVSAMTSKISNPSFFLLVELTLLQKLFNNCAKDQNFLNKSTAIGHKTTIRI